MKYFDAYAYILQVRRLWELKTFVSSIAATVMFELWISPDAESSL